MSEPKFCHDGELCSAGEPCLNCPNADHSVDATDMVNNPPHYKQGDIECIDAIRAALTPEEFRGYCKGNMIKYVWRERHKGGDESMRKAEWYGKQAADAPTR